MSLEAIRLEANLRQQEEAQKKWAESQPQEQGQATGFVGPGRPNAGQNVRCCDQSKPWVELSIEEKIERTREYAKNLQRENNAMFRRLRQQDALIRRLIGHRHGPEGELLEPFLARESHSDYGDCETKSSPEDPSKAYF